ncbi:hypothetical protein [Streptomyces sp. ALI-76-A]|uniref:hypothetical protein n=1 Tax=Streptomyces sp. ALI-76-A TaxID=3025736 RepID=UPI00256F4615|nr:hypothetical protein [Streptomyces sp. ALI-76-A]MDL5202511.1 hypothetical protein [Streptomyces sp. ALI-76-A]
MPGPAGPEVLDRAVAASPLHARCAQAVDREPTYEGVNTARGPRPRRAAARGAREGPGAEEEWSVVGTGRRQRQRQWCVRVPRRFRRHSDRP